MLIAGSAWAAPVGIPEVDAAQSAVEAQASKLGSARAALLQARSKYEALGHRIAARKATATPQDAILADLLRDSLAAGRALDARAKRRDAAAQAMGTSIRAAIAAIDRNIEGLRPGLKRGARRARAKVARQLKALVSTRNALRSQLAALASTRTAQRQWVQYEVEVDPLDGPHELGAKADFIEDTRDRFLAKRRALTSLIADAKQEREIARAAANFRTDVSHFDEDVRVGRVTRKGTETALTVAPKSSGRAAADSDGDLPTLAAGAQQESGSPSPADMTPGAGPAPPEPAAPPTAPPAAGFDDSANQRANTGATGAGGGGATHDPSPQSNEAAPQAPSAPAAPAINDPSLPRQINADVLLNLNVYGLDTSRVDVDQLEALLEDLTLLDAYLGQRAKHIRDRADQLDADEAQTLGDD